MTGALVTLPRRRRGGHEWLRRFAPTRTPQSRERIGGVIALFDERGFIERYPSVTAGRVGADPRRITPGKRVTEARGCEESKERRPRRDKSAGRLPAPKATIALTNAILLLDRAGLANRKTPL